MSARLSLAFAVSLLLGACFRPVQIVAEIPVPPAAEVSAHTGEASIVDGDTLDIRDNRYRFDGMDTPEKGSRCGEVNVYQKAALELAAIVEDRNVECEPTGKKNGRRLIATCFAIVPGGERVNLSEALVSMGWARDWPRFSQGKFAKLEQEARANQFGLWGLDCPDDLWGNRDYN